jgi:hypothetical protein
MSVFRTQCPLSLQRVREGIFTPVANSPGSRTTNCRGDSRSAERDARTINESPLFTLLSFSLSLNTKSSHSRCGLFLAYIAIRAPQKGGAKVAARESAGRRASCASAYACAKADASSSPGRLSRRRGRPQALAGSLHGRATPPVTPGPPNALVQSGVRRSQTVSVDSAMAFASAS